MITRRSFLASTAMAAAPVLSGSQLLNAAQSQTAAPPKSPGDSASLFLPVDDLKPATADRLPLSWNKDRVKRLQEKMAANGYDGILLTDRWNVIYFTGLWHTTTERLFQAFIPAKGSAPIWFYPALDRDLVRSWWWDDGDMYFDWLHAEGGFPNEGKVQMGTKVDLFEWMLKGLKARGFADKKLAADRELTPSAQAK